MKCLFFYLSLLNLGKEGDEFLKRCQEHYEEAMTTFKSFPIPEAFKNKGLIMSMVVYSYCI